MSAVRSVYRVVRSILFAAVITVAALIILLYIALSTPWVQDRIRNTAQKELASLFKAPVTIGGLDVSPFNELTLTDVEVLTPQNEKCVNVERLGVGINLWKLIVDRKVEITYAELIGLDGLIEQKAEHGPLNIQFIIDAFKPKKPGAPPAKFDIRLHNVVIRKSRLAWSKSWIPAKDSPAIDFNHIELRDIRADIEMPRLKNDDFAVNLKRLSFREKSGLYVDALSLEAMLDKKNLTVKNFSLKLEETEVKLGDLDMSIDGFASIPRHLKEDELAIKLDIKNLDPSDFAFLLPGLRGVPGVYNLTADVEGRIDNFTIRKFELHDEADHALDVILNGSLENISDFKSCKGSFSRIGISAESERVNDLMALANGVPDKVREIVGRLGFITTDLEGSFSLGSRQGYAKGYAETSQGLLDIEGKADWSNGGIAANAHLQTDGFSLGELMEKQPVKRFAADVTADFSVRGRDIDGSFDIDVPSLLLENGELQNFTASGTKQGNAVDVKGSIDSQLASGSFTASCTLAGAASQWNLEGELPHLNAAALGIGGRYLSSVNLGSIYASATGNNPDNITGEVRLTALNVQPLSAGKWGMDSFSVNVSGDDESRFIDIASDVLDGSATGSFKMADIPLVVRDILAYALPTYVKSPMKKPSHQAELSFAFTVKNDPKFFESFKITFRPERPVTLTGFLNDGELMAEISAPYLVKGEDKLYKNSGLRVTADRNRGLKLRLATDMPGKKSYVHADLAVTAFNDSISSLIGWAFEDSGDKGNVNVNVKLEKDVTGMQSFLFDIGDSDLVINGAQWKLTPAKALFSDRILSVDNLKVSHGDQSVTIDGKASASPTDTLTATLNDINLSYIFNTLNINYVNFGGYATGRAIVSNLFTKEPTARTDGLHVRDFAYNGALLGNAELSGNWDNAHKAVGIGARINGGKDNFTFVDGKIFVTRDSLCINFDADRINLALVHPFLSNVLDRLDGEASGKLSLYGTFKDITLTGVGFVDTASVKVGWTGVTYHGSDSVIFTKDRILIPGFRVFDKYGNSCVFSGYVHHDYFHNASLDFRIKDASRLLALDLDSKANGFWWGKVFASGSGRVSGQPGYSQVSFNGSTDPNSSFTFSMDETQTAAEYNFLTFTDSHKKVVEEEISEEEQLENRYRKKQENKMDEGTSIFDLDMSVTLNPNIKVNVIMDPDAGDKITATGNGAMRLHYNTFTDNIDMYGRYVLNDGSYRFSFQDIILRDFKIRPGSSISFNGDPMRGILDLTAGYRVNTSLTDLDKSFATDRDLNRSSIPVEALLKVSGQLESPDIAFDLSLPTMTPEVERKVRSIVSSDEMMSQQVLYLLALNRFYTPQFSGMGDGELMSVASSTLSSQVSNILSQITDKFTLNPSFKTDRSDFSDMEVDLALSSQLFDNRLIINGNLGYRDRSVSQSTFIGDFDIEYLLSKNGQLRLKAYNHFNDAYYYLKSALTTQGIGIIYRKDFNDPFAFLKHRRKKKEKGKTETSPAATENKSSSDVIIKDKKEK